ncbi:hypothetical protein S40285_02989 [Stachybotrys chlorohalonatus IBT 40285]|uniref:tRNA (uracil(54)-C(5))-methyltransferase n=1 Tax=Stachybotrys chlorohalonatus (strain IBT 40285) TaxID=1283841 RepID=A0A084QT35_STAC4|nr:hypothetical protein S40285_02989 [Stachybotrys chlorohalonata IBT 40285]
MSSAPAQAPAAAGPRKRPNHGGNGNSDSNNNNSRWIKNKKKTKREKNITECSSEDVLRNDIEALLRSRQEQQPEDAETAPESLPEEGTEMEVEVLDLSSTGDGLAMPRGSRAPHVYVVPFTVPGDTVRVKVFRHVAREKHSVADFLAVAAPSPLRDDARIQCRYFARCGGCQFQMLDYPEQLKLKKRVFEKAYRNFSNLAAELVPPVQDTIGSPLQYGYRTKLTPHFDGPPGSMSRKNRGTARFDKCPDIGFMLKGSRRVMDIEECPIGTEAVNLGMTRERERMQHEYPNYKRGATLLLRENTKRHPKDSPDAPAGELPPYTAKTETDAFTDVKTCETVSKTITTEYIGNYIFQNPAGSFFQNNNSILPVFTSYIRDHILPPSGDTKIKYLIDAYSGSGLFTITLSSVFQRSIGIDISADSIAFARSNATLNGLGEDRCTFIAADAGELFKSVKYDADETVVVLDPPRKGCDGDFLQQLRRFGPRRIVYVSCNVHTQARDVGVLVRGEGEGRRYEIESLRGFDFFPQTGHVEGVAILNRVEQVPETATDDGSVPEASG